MCVYVCVCARAETSFVYQNYRIRHSFESGYCTVTGMQFRASVGEESEREWSFDFPTASTTHPTKLIYTGFGDYQSQRTHLIYPAKGKFDHLNTRIRTAKCSSFVAWRMWHREYNVWLLKASALRASAAHVPYFNINSRVRQDYVALP